MPAGCEFICKNEKCEQCNSGFVITGPWGLADIDKVLNTIRIRKNKDFRDEILKWKEDGKKTFSISYPIAANDDIELIGYKVDKWCQKCTFVFHQEFLFGDEGQVSFDELISKHNPIKICPMCGEKLQDFTEVIENGINCKYCGEKMDQQRWFTNEREDPRGNVIKFEKEKK